MKVICYGVRETDLPYFKEHNTYGYEILLNDELLSHTTVGLAKGALAVMLRSNCKANRENLKSLADRGVKYILTRTVGYNQIDLAAAKEYGLKVANVPVYSPNAIGELAVTLAMMLLRNLAYTTNNTKDKNFSVNKTMFSREIRMCKVGIIGTGSIGLTTAKLFKGLGADVIAFDVRENPNADEVLKYVPFHTLLEESDIISIHIPYVKGQNEKLINKDFLSRMKSDALLINTSRGELQDDGEILNAILNNTIGGFATDVFATEDKYFYKNFQGRPLPDETVEKLISCYPKVLVTPHIGSYTKVAASNMIKISYDNLNEFITFGKCKNQL